MRERDDKNHAINSGAFIHAVTWLEAENLVEDERRKEDGQTAKSRLKGGF
jgi:hypothetical protein